MSATPYEANRALAYCSRMLALAATEWQLRENNPCTGIKRFPEKKRERFFADDELARIGEALAGAERDGTEVPDFILLVGLLATTSMRLGEALALRWSDVIARAAQSGYAMPRPTPAPCISVPLRRRSSTPPKRGAIMSCMGWTEPPLPDTRVRHAWARLREKAGIPDGRLHDVRHSVGTVAALAGANAFVVRRPAWPSDTGDDWDVARAADMVRATADAVSNRGRCGAQCQHDLIGRGYQNP